MNLRPSTLLPDQGGSLQDIFYDGGKEENRSIWLLLCFHDKKIFNFNIYIICLHGIRSFIHYILKIDSR